MKNVRTAMTLAGMAFSARTAVQRLRQVREEKDDRIELLDALLNIAVLVTGVIVVVRRLQRGEEET